MANQNDNSASAFPQESHTIFDYKVNDYIASQATFELLDKIVTRPDFLLRCINGGHVHGATSLAKSMFRIARELEHRGICVKAVVEGSPFDTCDCGHYRNEHQIDNGMRFFCLACGDCLIFALSERAEGGAQ